MADSPRSICLTGGAGFIGSHLAEAFLRRGLRVVTIDDFSTGLRSNVAPGLEVAELDVGSTAAAELVEGGGFDVLVHQAAQMNVRRSVEDVAFDARVNVLGTLNLLEAARRGGVRQVLFASSGGAIYGEQDELPSPEHQTLRPVSPYGVSKLACESYLYYYHHAYGLDVTCLRYANVYGPRQNPLGEAGVVAIFLERLVAGKTVTINGDGRQTRDYIFVDDVVAANLAALGRPGFNVYNVGTGIETDVVELYWRLAETVSSHLEPSHGPAKPGEQRRSVIEPTRARRELGLPDPLPLPAGLAATARWYRRIHDAG